MSAVRPVALAALQALALLAGAAHAGLVKIGLLETLSGPQASTGQSFRSGGRHAIDRLNAAGGRNGQPVQLVGYVPLPQPCCVAGMVD